LTDFDEIWHLEYSENSDGDVDDCSQTTPVQQAVMQ